METQKGPVKTTLPLSWGYMGLHVGLGKCRGLRGSNLHGVACVHWDEGRAQAVTCSTLRQAMRFVFAP